MTKEETKMLLAMVNGMFANFNPADIETAVNAWHFVLDEYPADTMAQALKRYASTENKGFPPTPGQLIEQIREAGDAERMTGLEAWEKVLKALRRSTYYAEEEYNKLPPDVQRCVGSPGVLRQWAAAEEENLGVMQANFLKVYSTKAAQTRKEEALPPGIRNLLKSVGGALMIGRGEDGEAAQTAFQG